MNLLIQCAGMLRLMRQDATTFVELNSRILMQKEEYIEPRQNNEKEIHNNVKTRALKQRGSAQASAMMITRFLDKAVPDFPRKIANRICFEKR